GTADVRGSYVWRCAMTARQRHGLAALVARWACSSRGVFPGTSALPATISPPVPPGRDEQSHRRCEGKKIDRSLRGRHGKEQKRRQEPREEEGRSARFLRV